MLAYVSKITMTAPCPTRPALFIRPCMTRLLVTSAVQLLSGAAGVIEPPRLMQAGEHPVRSRREQDVSERLPCSLRLPPSYIGVLHKLLYYEEQG